ncbi:hypothetical protein BGAL_0741g00010 [Botrytis galanthina]|uniref:Uncharacterized protein n=1 Tax=Botrytis galanthina TaxID=278940 RepID=A0A4S8QRI4_9HELO|nr:hypothetical protein BGAL_0741g00010 [Botrytis galanthina]
MSDLLVLLPFSNRKKERSPRENGPKKYKSITTLQAVNWSSDKTVNMETVISKTTARLPNNIKKLYEKWANKIAEQVEMKEEYCTMTKIANEKKTQKKKLRGPGKHLTLGSEEVLDNGKIENDCLVFTPMSRRL